jgi:hypothetical protein
MSAQRWTALLLTLSSASFMQPATAGREMDRAAECLWAAADHHQGPALVLWSMTVVESGFRPDAVNRNRNSSIELAVAQVNRVDWPELRRRGLPAASLQDLCINLYVRAWLYRQKLNLHGNSWKAVGATQSETPAVGVAYATPVADRILRGCALAPTGCRQVLHPGSPRHDGVNGRAAPSAH